MVGHGGSSAGSYLADPTSPIPSHCASIVVTSTVRVHDDNNHKQNSPLSNTLLLFNRYRFVRQLDREANKEFYPSLYYPELYILEGGYKCFWEEFPEKCTRNGAYKPMLHKDHNDDLKKFRAKSKTWTLGEGKGIRRLVRKTKTVIRF